MKVTMKLTKKAANRQRKPMAKVTYTHVGGRPRCGPLHISESVTHYKSVAVEKHALNATKCPDTFRGLCGVIVHTPMHSSADDREVTAHVQPAKDRRGYGVSCRDCRACLGLPRYAIEFLCPVLHEWFHVNGQAQHRTRKAATAAMKLLQEQFPKATDGRLPVTRFRVVRRGRKRGHAA